MGHDDTTKFGNATVRWSPTLDSEMRASIEAKMQAIRPTKARRVKVNHERARAAAEAHGDSVLSQPDTAEPTARANAVVRIYYRSMGDEILAFDTAPMTGVAASRLVSSIPDAIHWTIYQGNEERRLQHGARLVVLPSQRPEVSKEIWQTAPTLALVESESTPEPAPVAPPVGITAPVRRSYYADAMARRAARRAE